MILIPLALTLLRLVLGPFSIALALGGASRWVFSAILVAGLVSDIYDGVIARKLGVDHAWLRRFDSVTDAIFYFCIIVTAFIVAKPVMVGCLLPVACLVVLELAGNALSLVKFGVLPATHCYSAKLYGIALFISSSAVLSFGAGSWILWGLLAFGVLSNTETLAVLWLANEAPVDVKSIIHHLRRHARKNSS
jgi:CDP-diacylglycerol--glycerol-3-phosphate 3-phosphatidyltransferase